MIHEDAEGLRRMQIRNTIFLKFLIFGLAVEVWIIGEFINSGKTLTKKALLDWIDPALIPRRLWW